ncbi:MAG: GGDEF domain-containing protein [Gammaproteobacteria bacterium]
MGANSSGHDAEHWKQKYYDQLDQLDKKEKHWAGLESILKKTISRLSLAAEGSHDQVDQHLQDIRAAVKDRINLHRLELILEDLSKLLAHLEEKKVAPDKQVMSLLQALLDNLQLPKKADKQRQQLLKQIARSNDDDKDALLSQVIVLLKSALEPEAQTEQKKAGFFEKLLGTSDARMSSMDVAAIVQVLNHVLQLLPWPDALVEDSQTLVKKIAASDSEKAISNNLAVLEKLLLRWRQQPLFESSVPVAEVAAFDQLSDHKQSASAHSHDVISQRDFFCELLLKLEQPLLSETIRETLQRSAQQVELDQQLSDLSDELVVYLKQSYTSSGTPAVSLAMAKDDQPSSQELLIRLLEQLIVPVDMQPDVDAMKQRLEENIDTDEWRLVLKDVASLINAIRSQMQQEKHEFENFLQQLTDRLLEMDDFLRIESESNEAAEKDGQVFDQRVQGQVQDIRDDVGQATSLEQLKGHVERRLDEMTSHIHSYRDTENHRLQEAQKNVNDMQTRMASMEQETDKLKQIIVLKNRQAMVDVLTEIPNRLAYEQTVEAEIARWKRFNKPLTLVMWDVDLFKKVNDTYGHKAGDKVLKTIAQLLNSRIRETDFLARYGGEEFIMLLPGTDETETRYLSNELRSKVEECGFHYHGERVVITVSCGISGFGEGDVLAQVFERADKALYQAKKNGRNQCQVATT